MQRTDRLSALVSRFALEVRSAPCAEANLAVLRAADDSSASRIVFSPPSGTKVELAHELCDSMQVVFSAKASMGGHGNPLLRALPPVIDFVIDDDPDMQSLVSLLVAESQNARCGAESVVNRLGEVLLVRLLRELLANGSTDVGLLAGLADARLSRAIVAMHESPGRAWRIDDLATEAGMSTSRFAAHFAQLVGQTPMSYLRHWRMALARQDIDQGDRVQVVANRYGYASTEALSRAFRKHYGRSPLALRDHVA
ncbi:MAG: AraC family transcriptional regulator [Pseudomonadota bacterium]